MREVGNVGLGNAMMALSTMIDQGVNMAIPDVNIVPLSAFTEMVGGARAYLPVFICPSRAMRRDMSLSSCRKPVRVDWRTV